MTVAIIVVFYSIGPDRDAGITRSYIYIHYRRSNNTLAVNCDEGKYRFTFILCKVWLDSDRGRKDLEIRDRAFSQSE